jgi:hypothetical protein
MTRRYLARRFPQQWIAEVRANQRNIVWPDLLVNSRAVDAFLWRGSPNASLVQRIGACLFGLTFFVGGVVLLSLSWSKASPVLALFSLAWVLVGARVITNGVRRRGTK